MSTDIVKRQGKRPTEPFQSEKLYQSIMAVCLSMKAHEREAEQIAKRVTELVAKWTNEKPKVTSGDIRLQVLKHLEKLHKDAAYFYKHHRQLF